MSHIADHDQLAFSIKDFCRSISLSKSSFWKLVRNGTAPPMARIGHRLVIRREAAEAWLKEKETV